MQILLYLHTAFGAKIHDVKKKGRSKLCECVFYATERVDASARNVICLHIIQCRFIILQHNFL